MTQTAIHAAGAHDRDSYLCNNLLKLRPDDEGPIFVCHADDSITARLDGYAIIPRTEYEALLRFWPVRLRTWLLKRWHA